MRTPRQKNAARDGRQIIVTEVANRIGTYFCRRVTGNALPLRGALLIASRIAEVHQWVYRHYAATAAAGPETPKPMPSRSADGGKHQNPKKSAASATQGRERK